MRSIKLPSSIERLLGLDPRGVPPHVFFVDERQLAYAGFERRSEDAWALTSWARVDLPPGCFQSGRLGGPLKNREGFDAALAQITEAFPGPVKEASLVLPDAWVRVSFTEGGDLPAEPEARQDVLRFKLKRLVPFRVEDRRVSGLELGSSEGRPPRLILAFALESLLSQLEDAFQAAGIRLGQVVGSTLALLAAVEPEPETVLALALVRSEADYTLSFVRGSEPLLHRYKSVTESVERDLLLTRSFLEDHLGPAGVDRTLLVVPPELEPRWVEWMHEGFTGVEVLGARHLHLTPESVPSAPTPPWELLAPMAGAASREIP